jgi:hypothetical protein
MNTDLIALERNSKTIHHSFIVKRDRSILTLTLQTHQDRVPFFVNRTIM